MMRLGIHQPGRLEDVGVGRILEDNSAKNRLPTALASRLDIGLSLKFQGGWISRISFEPLSQHTISLLIHLEPKVIIVELKIWKAEAGPVAHELPQQRLKCLEISARPKCSGMGKNGLD